MRSLIKVDYGTDAPGVIRNLIFFAALGLLIVVLFPKVHVGIVTIDTTGLIWMSVYCALGAGLMLMYVKYGKFRHRDAMLNLATWRGDESVLDIGTGKGLLLIGAAKLLTTGKATGIDIWSETDLTDNAAVNTMYNATAEGVENKITVLSMNAAKMEFADESFDIILSNLCIHNIKRKGDRKNACIEIARVMKKGGIGLICDFIHIFEYRKVFKECGLKVSLCYGSWFTTFPPLITLKLEKIDSNREII